MILFVNDSYFSYLLARPLIQNYSEFISLIILSTRVQGSLSQIAKISRKSNIDYFCYRSIVQAFSIFNGMIGRKTVKSLADKYNIEVIRLPSVNKSKQKISSFGPFDIGFAFNFDQIIGKDVLDLCKIGVINVHASKLPNDKGISPVLWAFARGDTEIWSTIYKMDAGIDSGPIAEQFKIPVDANSTAFSVYKKVCIESGKRLVSILRELEWGRIAFQPQVTKGDETYWSWPNNYHRILMKQQKRRYLKFSDIIAILK
jgi:hypothetical protein